MNWYLLIYFLKQTKRKNWLLGIGAVIGVQNFLKGKLLNNKLFILSYRKFILLLFFHNIWYISVTKTNAIDRLWSDLRVATRSQLRRKCDF